MENKKRQTAEPRPAATVILVREHGGELQVYLMKRSSGSRFMPETYVFPGGTIDSEDRRNDVWMDRADLDSEGLAQRLGGGLSLEEILANGVCAIRETFEEAGVLLARSDEMTLLESERIYRMRLAGDLPKGWLLDLVISEGWILGFSDLSRWAHWITPERMKRRFDTRFFVALMPDGQACTPDAKETTHGIWVKPEEGLAGNLSGDIPLGPPTLIALHKLLEFGSLQDLKAALATRPWGKPQRPKLIPSSQGPVILQPWDPMRHHEGPFDFENLEGRLLKVGEPFSRIWFHEGIWKPIKE